MSDKESGSEKHSSRPSRRRFLGATATTGVTVLAGCNDVDIDVDVDEEAQSGDDGPPPWETGLGWTGRFAEVSNAAWASRRNMDADRYSMRMDQYEDNGHIPIDIGANADGDDVSYSAVWRENVDGRDWEAVMGIDSADLAAEHTAQSNDGMRPLTIEGYYDDEEPRYGAIWIENLEELDWWADWDLTNEEFGNEFDTLRDDGGYRPIDVETYHYGEEDNEGIESRIAGVWWEDVDDVLWAHLRNMPRDSYLDNSSDYYDDGYRTIDFESYIWRGNRRYAAIWVDPGENHTTPVRTNRSSVNYANRWYDYADQGFRIVDQEAYGNMYAGIWVENADRYRYEHRTEIDSIIDDYRDDHEVPGISVVLIDDGDTVYRRGFGDARKDEGRDAHARTVYNTASVSKVLGATLAARLEAVGELQDGTSVDLNLTDHVTEYLGDPDIPGKPSKDAGSIPANHDYRVEKLFSHLACVPHYEFDPDNPSWGATLPGVDNLTSHFDTATEAARQYWWLPSVHSTQWNDFTEDFDLQSCEIGEDRVYSTFGFTLAGAVLEQATGRPIDQLVREELAEPFGLNSTRAMFGSEEPQPDSQRALKDGEDEYTNSSWKVLGGGIESTALDLANFAWQLHDGQIVDHKTLTTRVWAPVASGCDSPFESSDLSPDPKRKCNNGLGWRLEEEWIDSENQFVVEHGGSWSGAGSQLAVLPEHDLVFAALSNKGGSGQDLDDELMVDILEEHGLD